MENVMAGPKIRVFTASADSNSFKPCEGSKTNLLLNADQLKKVLSGPQHAENKCVILIELPPWIRDYRLEVDFKVVDELSGMLEQSISMPKSIFEEHMQRGTLFRANEEFEIPKLPSQLQPNKHFLLPFFETRTCDRARSASDDSEMSCASTARQIQCHEWREQITQGPLFIIPRHASFWSSDSSKGKWHAVILCDPPLRQVYAGSELKTVVPNSPFKGGYPEFIPTWLRKGPAPPRKSLFADLTHHFTHHSGLLPDLSSPLSASFFLQKIVIGHYQVVLSFLKHQIAIMRGRGWAIREIDDDEPDEAREVESNWIKFRCSEILEDLERLMDALGMSWSSNSRNSRSREQHVGQQHHYNDNNNNNNNEDDDNRFGDWTAIKPDLLWLHRELVQCRALYDMLTGSVAALAGVTVSRRAVAEARSSTEEAQRALREARSTRTLTVIAMVFAPLSWTSQLFSMSGSFAPGERWFALYFAVALPSTLAVVAMAMVAHMGFDARADWSVGTIGRQVKKVFLRYARSTSTKLSEGDDSVSSMGSSMREDVQVVDSKAAVNPDPE